MTRYELLLAYYHNLDTVTTGLILFAFWAAGTGHLIDWMTEHRCKFLVPIYWSIVIILYTLGIIIVGTKFS